MVKNRLPIPSDSPALSVTTQPMVWTPLVYRVVSIVKQRIAWEVSNDGNP